MSSFLARVGLGRPELRAWAMYDWAVSAMQTTIMAAVFPIYFVKVASAGLPAGQGSARLAYANTVAMLLVTVLSPVLGALADHSAAKKRFLFAFALIGAAGCAGMFWIGRGDVGLASVLYAVSMVGAQGSMAFYGALLPHLVREDEVDRVSTAGYAVGYLGGGLLLAAQLLWITHPAWFGLPSGPGLTPDQATLPTRLALASVSVWWLVFSIPLLRRVPEPPVALGAGEPRENVLVAPFVRLAHTVRDIGTFKQAALLLVAFMIYNDGIQTVIKLATAYGTELGIPEGSLIAAILLVQFVGIPCAVAFGKLADPSKVSAEERQAYLDDWSRPGALTAMLNWYRATDFVVPAPGEDAAMPAWADGPFPPVQPPTLVIWGMADKALLPVELEGLEDHVQLLHIERVDAGHFVPWEAPDAVIAAIRGFLAAR